MREGLCYVLVQEVIGVNDRMKYGRATQASASGGCQTGHGTDRVAARPEAGHTGLIMDARSSNLGVINGNLSGCAPTTLLGPPSATQHRDALMLHHLLRRLFGPGLSLQKNSGGEHFKSNRENQGFFFSTGGKKKKRERDQRKETETRAKTDQPASPAAAISSHK